MRLLPILLLAPSLALAQATNVAGGPADQANAAAPANEHAGTDQPVEQPGVNEHGGTEQYPNINNTEAQRELEEQQAQAAQEAEKPPPTPQENAARVQQLQQQVTALQQQLGTANEQVQALQQQLEQAEQQNAQFQQQTEQLANRGSDIETQRVERIQTRTAVGENAASVDELMAMGADDLDQYLQNMEAALVSTEQSAGATSGALEYGHNADAIANLEYARQALANGDYYGARVGLANMALSSFFAQDAAAGNPQRAWTGQ